MLHVHSELHQLSIIFMRSAIYTYIHTIKIIKNILTILRYNNKLFP